MTAIPQDAMPGAGLSSASASIAFLFVMEVGKVTARRSERAVVATIEAVAQTRGAALRRESIGR